MNNIRGNKIVLHELMCSPQRVQTGFGRRRHELSAFPFVRLGGNEIRRLGPATVIYWRILRLTFTAAETNCGTIAPGYNGHLLSLTSAAEANFVWVNLFGSSTGKCD